jgi:hypothetical protein
MKQGVFLSFILMLCLSCEKDPVTDLDLSVLEGTWILIEALRDADDGSRIFTPVDSEREITIAPDNSFSTNYDVCQSIEDGEKFSGSFIRIEAQELLIPCAESLLNSVQGKLENGHLILYYPCIIPCAYKFKKIADFKE